MSHRRVVITGLGALSPIGNTAPTSWASAIEGKSGIGRISLFDASDCPVQIAGEIKGFEPTAPFAQPFKPHGQAGEALLSALGPKDLKKLGRFTQMALVASGEAYRDSGLDSLRDQIRPERIGVNIGVGMGGLGEIENVHSDYLEKGYKRITPFFITQVIPNLAAGMVSMAYNLKGPNLCITTACTSSAHAIGESLWAIRRGHADVMFAGGAEAVVCRMGIGGFAAMRALSTRNADPTLASRPYDKDRDGFVMGEGSAILILEEYEHARKRGAKIYGEVLGYGLSADAYHITSPAPEGEGGYRSMQLALEDAKIPKDRVSYANSHGTSTPAGDSEEARAISKLFGAQNIQVSSTKSMTGHMLGAAGAIEALFSVLAIRDGIIPPTINLEEIDPECAATGLDFTPKTARSKKIQCAISNSFGFGGTNGSLIFGKV